MCSYSEYFCFFSYKKGSQKTCVNRTKNDPQRSSKNKKTGPKQHNHNQEQKTAHHQRFIRSLHTVDGSYTQVGIHGYAHSKTNTFVLLASRYKYCCTYKTTTIYRYLLDITLNSTNYNTQRHRYYVVT